MFADTFDQLWLIILLKKYLKNVLNVLELTKIELATDEDRLCGRDHWAKLFKAKTWED